MKTTSKRLLALLAGWLGLRAILRRRAARSAREPSPADELKAKLASTKEPEPDPQAEPDPQPEPHLEPAPGLEAEAAAAPPEGVDERRADAHARARHAIEELREKRD